MLRSRGNRCGVIESSVVAELDVGLSQRIPYAKGAFRKERLQGLLKSSDRNSLLTYSSRHSIEVRIPVCERSCRCWVNGTINWADVEMQLSR